MNNDLVSCSDTEQERDLDISSCRGARVSTGIRAGVWRSLVIAGLQGICQYDISTYCKFFVMEEYLCVFKWRQMTVFLKYEN